MKENEIKNAFDKIKLSKEKENLIANNIIENREIRIGRKVNYPAWRRAAEVCLLVVLCAAVVVTPLVFSTINNNPPAGVQTDNTNNELSAGITSDNNDISSNGSNNQKYTPYTVMYKDMSKNNPLDFGMFEWKDEQPKDVKKDLPPKKITFRGEEFSLKYAFSVNRSYESYIADVYNFSSDTASGLFSFNSKTGKIDDYIYNYNDNNYNGKIIEKDDEIYKIISEFLALDEISLDFNNYNHIEKSKTSGQIKVEMYRCENNIRYGDVIYFDMDKYGHIERFSYSESRNLKSQRSIVERTDVNYINKLLSDKMSDMLSKAGYELKNIEYGVKTLFYHEDGYWFLNCDVKYDIGKKIHDYDDPTVVLVVILGSDIDSPDLTYPNASHTKDFQQIDITIDSKKAIKFISKNGKITILCTTDKDIEKVSKQKVVINGYFTESFITSESAYRIGIQYLPNSTNNINYCEYMSDGTVRYYEVHPDNKIAKVLYTCFIVTDSPDSDSSYNKD